MMSGSEEEGFKVTDRRRRAEDAEDRGRGPVELPRAAAPAAAPAVAPAPEAKTTPEVKAPPADAGRSLVGLFMMLASSAAVALGVAPDPMTGQMMRDPEQAAEAIDLLVLLREKTEGNRTPEETQILEEIVYDLQLRYVEVMKKRG